MDLHIKSAPTEVGAKERKGLSRLEAIGAKNQFALSLGIPEVEPVVLRHVDGRGLVFCLDEPRPAFGGDSKIALGAVVEVKKGLCGRVGMDFDHHRTSGWELDGAARMIFLVVPSEMDHLYSRTRGRKVGAFFREQLGGVQACACGGKVAIERFHLGPELPPCFGKKEAEDEECADDQAKNLHPFLGREELCLALVVSRKKRGADCGEGENRENFPVLPEGDEDEGEDEKDSRRDRLVPVGVQPGEGLFHECLTFFWRALRAPAPVSCRS